MSNFRNKNFGREKNAKLSREKLEKVLKDVFTTAHTSKEDGYSYGQEVAPGIYYLGTPGVYGGINALKSTNDSITKQLKQQIEQSREN